MTIELDDDEHRELSDDACDAIKRLTHDGCIFVLGVLSWDAPEALLAAIDMAADEVDGGYLK